MLIVTGPIASGKSTLVEVARRMGYNCIDADEWFNQVFLKTGAFYNTARIMLDGQTLSEAAFTHERWKLFEEYVDLQFLKWLNEWNQYLGEPDILVIPDFFNRPIYEMMKGQYKVLTIERLNNVEHALARDTMRDEALTRRIAENQMGVQARISLSDGHIINKGTKEDFEKVAETWLKLHLPEVLTHRM